MTRVKLRLAPSLAALAGMSLLVAACGGSSTRHVAQLGTTTATSSSNAAAASAQVSGAVAFSRCMRSHAVPAYPDPESGGGSC